MSLKTAIHRQSPRSRSRLHRVTVNLDVCPVKSLKRLRALLLHRGFTGTVAGLDEIVQDSHVDPSKPVPEALSTHPVRFVVNWHARKPSTAVLMRQLLELGVHVTLVPEHTR